MGCFVKQPPHSQHWPPTPLQLLARPESTRLPILSSFCKELSSAGSHRQDVGLTLREEEHRPLLRLSSSTTVVLDPSSVPGAVRWLWTNSSWGRGLETSPNALPARRWPPPAHLAVGTDSASCPKMLHARRPSACSS